MNRPALALLILTLPLTTAGSERLTRQLTYTPGSVNRVTIQHGGKQLAVYGVEPGDASVDTVLLTHHRRDVLSFVQPAIDRDADIVAPLAERDLIEQPQEFWESFTVARFHDYAQQSTKILDLPLKVKRWVKPNDSLSWQGIEFHVLDTPGYTRGAVSYWMQLAGKRVAFTGDLIYGDGQLLDLYSFQDAIPEAKIRGYHGYGSRLALLVASLKRVKEIQPDLIVPTRGPIIHNPQQAIDKLIRRVRNVYKNYLSTCALNWYFKEERMETCGKRVLGEDSQIELMPYCLHQKTPDWVFEQSTSRLLISDEGHGFLLDCGPPRVIDAVKDLINSGLVKKVDGIFVTHYHDDHTNNVQAAANEFNCPVYAMREYEDVLEHPEAYHLPAMTDSAIREVQGMNDGDTMRWQEFEFTFHDYPGQTYYHGGLFVRKKGEKPIFFVGDSFAPSGIDDYCVLNRNLLHKDSGYQLCLQKLRDVKEEFWIVNEHIPYVFAFSDEEMSYLESRYTRRVALLRELFPWDDPNYGIDEQWAVFYPYGIQAKQGKSIDLEIRLHNHSPVKRTFDITPHVGGGGQVIDCQRSITLASRQSGNLKLRVTAPKTVGHHLVTADIRSAGMQFNDWIEALVTVEDGTE